MNILVDTTGVQVKECTLLRNNRNMTLKIVVDATEMTFEEFCKVIKDNAGDIAILDDNEAVTEIYSGFHHNLRISYDSVNETHTARIECMSEVEYQNGLLKKQIADQNAIIEQLQNTIASQQQEILDTQLAVCTMYESMVSSPAESVEDTETTESEVVE